MWWMLAFINFWNAARMAVSLCFAAFFVWQNRNCYKTYKKSIKIYIKHIDEVCKQGYTINITWFTYRNDRWIGFGVGSPLKGYTKDIFIRGSENCTQDETGRSDRAAKNTGLPGRPASAWSNMQNGLRAVFGASYLLMVPGEDSWQEL